MDLFDHAPGPQPLLRRYFKPLLVFVSLVLAMCLTVRRSGPHGRVDVGAGEPLRAAQNNNDKRPYDLAALRIFNNTLMRVNDSYVDPTRVDPKQMLLSSLDQVQKSVAEVLVEPHPEQNKVIVSVDTAQQQFSIARGRLAVGAVDEDEGDLPLHRAEPAAGHGHRDGAQRRVRGDERHAVDARSALDAARSDRPTPR